MKKLKNAYNDTWNAQYAGVSDSSKSGRLLRKYWHPILLSSEIPPRTIKKFKILNEDLVIFRLPNGKLGALPERCPHRGASLNYGFIEEDGIRCAYHGWKFSPNGQIIESPFGSYPIKGINSEPDCKSNKIKAYETGGVIFVCLSPDRTSPELPNWDILLSDSDEIVVQRHVVECNWFQYQENAADVTHTLFLHGSKLRSLGIPESSGFFSLLTWYSFSVQSFGLVKAWLYEGRDIGWGNLAIFPNILRIKGEMHWRIPISNEQTLIFQVSGRSFNNTPKKNKINSVHKPKTPEPAVEIETPPVYSQEGDAFSLYSFQGQDAAACVTQGKIAPRHFESLSTSDYGILLYREAWQNLCENDQSPAEIYNMFKTQNMLDLRPWLGDRDIAVSRPVSEVQSSSSMQWSDIFDGSEPLITVPRGSAGEGPLG